MDPRRGLKRPRTEADNAAVSSNSSPQAPGPALLWPPPPNPPTDLTEEPHEPHTPEPLGEAPPYDDQDPTTPPPYEYEPQTLPYEGPIEVDEQYPAPPLEGWNGFVHVPRPPRSPPTHDPANEPVVILDDDEDPGEPTNGEVPEDWVPSPSVMVADWSPTPSHDLAMSEPPESLDGTAAPGYGTSPGSCPPAPSHSPVYSPAPVSPLPHPTAPGADTSPPSPQWPYEERWSVDLDDREYVPISPSRSPSHSPVHGADSPSYSPRTPSYGPRSVAASRSPSPDRSARSPPRPRSPSETSSLDLRDLDDVDRPPHYTASHSPQRYSASPPRRHHHSRHHRSRRRRSPDLARTPTYSPVRSESGDLSDADPSHSHRRAAMCCGGHRSHADPEDLERRILDLEHKLRQESQRHLEFEQSFLGQVADLQADKARLLAENTRLVADNTMVQGQLQQWQEIMRPSDETLRQMEPQELDVVLMRMSRAETDVKVIKVEQSVCVVCLERPKKILFAPCRHQCTCPPCAARLSSCPLCRTPIVNSFQPY